MDGILTGLLELFFSGSPHCFYSVLFYHRRTYYVLGGGTRLKSIPFKFIPLPRNFMIWWDLDIGHWRYTLCCRTLPVEVWTNASLHGTNDQRKNFKSRWWTNGLVNLIYRDIREGLLTYRETPKSFLTGKSQPSLVLISPKLCRHSVCPISVPLT